MIFQKLLWDTLLLGLLSIVTKTEESLVTDLSTSRGYANMKLNATGKTMTKFFYNLLRHPKSARSSFNRSLDMIKQDGPWKPGEQQVEKFTLETTTTMIKKKLRLCKKDWFGAEKNKLQSLIQFVAQDNRKFELKPSAMEKVSVGDINNGMSNDESQPTVVNQCLTTRCRTMGPVVTITKIDDQTIDPNLTMRHFAPFTPRTRTVDRRDLRPTTARYSTKKWRCYGKIEDEPATEKGATIGTLWQVTLSTRMPKAPTANNPFTKGFLRMTSTDRWRIRPADRFTKAHRS